MNRWLVSVVAFLLGPWVGGGGSGLLGGWPFRDRLGRVFAAGRMSAAPRAAHRRAHRHPHLPRRGRT